MCRNKIIAVFLALIMTFGVIFQSLGPVYAEDNNTPDETNVIWLDGNNGNDANNGLSQAAAVNTFAKALALMPDGGTINVCSLTENSIKFNKAGHLNFTEDVTLQGDGSLIGITLGEGAHLGVADGKTLTMSGYKTAIEVKKGAEINDGNYVFKFPNNGFAFDTSGNIVGSSKDKLKIDITNGYFMFHSKDNELRNATINQRYDDNKWQLYEWNGFKAFDSEINLYRLPVYLKGPLYLDNTKFVIDGTGVNYQTGAYFENSWEVGVFHFTNNSIFEVKNFNTHWRAKGITFGYGNKVLVDNEAKIVVKNNGNGGFNDNQGIATFNGGYLEGEGHSGSLFGAQDKADTKIVFGPDSVVNTPMKSQTDNGLGQSGSNYIVIGGSHKVKYDPGYQGGLAIPVNGEENGNEKLTWFQLTDKSIDKLTPINKNGNTYDYSVKNPSDDGNKYVWTPAAKVTFKLNNNDASFADGTTDNKVVKTIRGYKLDDVVGNTQPGNPSDKNGVNFLGWFYKTPSGEEKSFNWEDRFVSDLEVYAKWERKTVVYHNGHGKDYIVSVKKDAKNTEVLSLKDILKEKADFKVEGKNFVGWTESPDGSGKEYKAKDQIAFTEGKSQIDLYAKYTDNEYTVSFSANGGTFSEDSIFKTNKEVFTIKQDADGGEVAVLNKKANYNDKLFDLLGEFDHNQLKPDTNATKTGFVIGNKDYWSTTAETGGKAIRFDDYSFFGFSMKGENPQITADTTYYLTWKDDPNITTISAQGELDSDIWGNNRENSTAVQVVDSDEAFSLTGEVNVAPIKAKMAAIETEFNKGETDFDQIALTGAKSTFTATLTMPEGIVIPENPAVTAKGLGDCFDLSATKVEGQQVTVTFKLKAGMDNYKKLKEAVDSTGEQDNILSVTVAGFKFKDFAGINDGKKFTVTGRVTGDFFAVAKDKGTTKKFSMHKETPYAGISAVAKDNGTIKKFSFTWTGKQSASGKDVEAQEDSSIQYTLMVSKPLELTLAGDLLVKKGTESYNTEHDAIYPVLSTDVLTFKGQLNVSPIKNQIDELKRNYEAESSNSSDKITTQNIKSTFTATLTMPEGFNIPDDLTATLTENDLFKVENIKKDGQKIIVSMALKKDYTKFTDLHTDVTSVPDELNLEIPDISLNDKAKGNMTVKGEVLGTFTGEATTETGTMKPFNFKWKAKQTAEGKDFAQSQDDNDTIQLTVSVKEPEPKVERRPHNPTNTSSAKVELNVVDHYAYMKGYPDKTFGPDQEMTRAEATMMFARLLKDRPEANKTYIMPYKDLDKDEWYAYAVSFMSEKKIINGYPDGTFRPDAKITRAEFATIAAKFDKLEDVNTDKFSDVTENHWAYHLIGSAEAKGWISGYPDGTFKPEKNISRAEVVSCVNRMLNRYADLDFAEAHISELAPMVDMTTNHWAYGPIVEAMNGHDYERLTDGKSERWVKLNGKRFTFPIPPDGRDL